MLALYRAQVGGSLVPVTLGSQVPVDAVAALDRKNGLLSLGLVNYSASQEAVVSLKVTAGTLPRTAQAWRISGPSLTAINVLGQPEAVTTQPLPAPNLCEPIHQPAHSITVVKGRR